MYIAELDCKTKKISFIFKGENFIVDLKEGDLPCSWNNISLKNGESYNTEFTWDEDSDECEPCLSLYLTELIDGEWQQSEEFEWHYDVVYIGEKETYFLED
jgi:hypothetical protein